MIRLLAILGMLLTVGGVSGCAPEVDCFVADRIEVVDEVSIDGDTYTVVLRTSGMQDKQHFYELYPGVPEFDDCGVASVKAVSQTYVDVEKGSVSDLVIDDLELKPVYATPGDGPAASAAVPVKVR